MRSPDLEAAMAASRRDAYDLLDVLTDPASFPEQLLLAADRARRSVNELWTLAGCDVRRRRAGPPSPSGRGSIAEWESGSSGEAQGGRRGAA